jgi:ankyrin repeat protein
MTKDEATRRFIQLINQSGGDNTIDTKEVKRLHRRGVDPNVRGNNEKTLLHRAVEARDLKLIELLLILGADSNLADKDGLTPLDWAKRVDDGRIVDILRKNKGKTKEELENEEKKKKQPRVSGGGQRAGTSSSKSGSQSGSKSGSKGVGSGGNSSGGDNSERDLSDDLERLSASGSGLGSGLGFGSMDPRVSGTIPQQPTSTSRNNWKALNPRKQARNSASKQVEENIQTDPTRIVLHVNPAGGIEFFWRVLVEILRLKPVGSDKEVFSHSHSSKENGYYSGGASTRPEQLAYSEWEYRKHFNGILLSGME